MNSKYLFSLIFLIAVTLGSTAAFAAGRPNPGAHQRARMVHDRTPKAHNHSVQPHH
jgi:hypothetical protein